MKYLRLIEVIIIIIGVCFIVYDTIFTKKFVCHLTYYTSNGVNISVAVGLLFSIVYFIDILIEKFMK